MSKTQVAAARLELHSISKRDMPSQSAHLTMRGFECIASADCFTNSDDGARYIRLRCVCTPMIFSVKWNCQVVFDAELLNQDASQPSSHYSWPFATGANVKNPEDWYLMSWDQFIGNTSPWVTNGRASIEVRVRIEDWSVEGYNGERLGQGHDGVEDVDEIPRLAFDTDEGPLSDVVLEVGERQLHVNRAFLSIYSPVFKSMFYGEFAERSMGIVPLLNVHPDEFVELLNVIYPTRKPIDDANVAYLLKLSDQFDIATVRRECVTHLLTSRMDDITKLMLVDKYRLHQLKPTCVRAFDTQEKVRRLMASPEYEQLSDQTKVIVFEKHLRRRRVHSPPDPAPFVETHRIGASATTAAIVLGNLDWIFQRLLLSCFWLLVGVKALGGSWI